MRQATYAATKAFNATLGESLWVELRRSGVDVLTLLPGVTDTHGFRHSGPDRRSLPGRSAMSPARVAEEALAALSRGEPLCVPGAANRLFGLLAQRVMPRRLTIALLERSMRALYPAAW